MPVVAQAGQAGAVDRHEPVEELRDELGHAVFFEERLDRGGAARRLQVLLPQRSRVAHRVADEEQDLDPAEPRGPRRPRQYGGVVVPGEPGKELFGRQHRPRRTGGAGDHPQAQLQLAGRAGGQPQTVALADLGPLLDPDALEDRIGEACFRERVRVLAQRRLQPGRAGLAVAHVQVEGRLHGVRAIGAGTAVRVGVNR